MFLGVVASAGNQLTIKWINEQNKIASHHIQKWVEEILCNFVQCRQYEFFYNLSTMAFITILSCGK